MRRSIISLRIIPLDRLDLADLQPGAAFRAGSRPGVAAIEHVIALPCGRRPHRGGWGLYNRDLSALPHSIVRRGQGERPFRQADRLARRPWFSRRIPGRAFYLGPVIMEFGHFLLETMARLWAYPALGAEIDYIAYHGTLSPGRIMENYPFARALLAAIGIGADRLLRIDRSMVFDEIVVAEPACEPRHYVYPALVEFFAHVSRNLLSGEAIEETSQPLYFSKARLSSGISILRGLERLETMLAARGVRVVYPETLSLIEQVRLINSHKIISGPIGSSFHLLLLAQASRRCHYIVPNGFFNANYPMIDAAKGNDSRYYLVDAERTASKGFMFAHSIADDRPLVEAMLRDLSI